MSGKQALYDKLLVQFLDSAPKEIGSLQDNLASNNLDRMRRISHALKGSAGTLGAIAVQAAAASLEAAIKDVEEALKSDDKAAIEAKTEALTTASQKLGEKVYAAQQAEANTESAQPQGEKTVDGDVVDAEFEEVKKD